MNSLLRWRVWMHIISIYIRISDENEKIWCMASSQDKYRHRHNIYDRCMRIHIYDYKCKCKNLHARTSVEEKKYIFGCKHTKGVKSVEKRSGKGIQIPWNMYLDWTLLTLSVHPGSLSPCCYYMLCEPITHLCTNAWRRKDTHLQSR